MNSTPSNEVKMTKLLKRLNIVAQVWAFIMFVGCICSFVYMHFIQEKIQIRDDDNQLEQKLAQMQHILHNDLYVARVIFYLFSGLMILVCVIFGLRLYLKRVGVKKDA